MTALALALRAYHDDTFIKCLKTDTTGETKSRIDSVIMQERDKPGKECWERLFTRD